MIDPKEECLSGSLKCLEYIKNLISSTNKNESKATVAMNIYVHATVMHSITSSTNEMRMYDSWCRK